MLWKGFKTFIKNENLIDQGFGIYIGLLLLSNIG